MVDLETIRIGLRELDENRPIWIREPYHCKALSRLYATAQRKFTKSGTHDGNVSSNCIKLVCATSAMGNWEDCRGPTMWLNAAYNAVEGADQTNSISQELMPKISVAIHTGKRSIAS